MSIEEEFETPDGEKVERIKSSFFYVVGVLSFFLGIFLVSDGVKFGVFLILFLAPIMILYPFVRFLFGGKDGLVPFLATVILEEYLKFNIKESHRKKKKKKC